MYINYSFMHDFFQVWTQTPSEAKDLKAVAEQWGNRYLAMTYDPKLNKVMFTPVAVEDKVRDLFNKAIAAAQSPNKEGVD